MASPILFFTENETNEKFYSNPNYKGYAKDAFDQLLIHDDKSAVNPAQHGTKSAAVYRLNIPGQNQASVRLRLKSQDALSPKPFDSFDQTLNTCQQEADEFFDSITPKGLTSDQRNVMRQAIAGMLWSKQLYFLDNDRWLREHGSNVHRNADWSHILNADVISMPDMLKEG
jgi:hypothetical protein